MFPNAARGHHEPHQVQHQVEHPVHHHHHHQQQQQQHARQRYFDPQPATAHELPRIGETRCYWALLTTDLEFAFLDPVLAHHLGAQKDPIMGRSLLDFVHPDEKSSAAVDLGDVLETKTLHGSVTRVRYCRLGRVRKLLGFSGTPDVPPAMRPVFFDDNYMACDLVINLASDGLVLCFIHAVVDLHPEDNDERSRTQWTNWCGTATGSVTPEHSSFLRRQLEQTMPPRAADPYTRVFQVLENSADRAIVFSWPPEVSSDDYGRLARDIQMQFAGPDGQKEAAEGSAKTSCTRRYKAQQWLLFADGVEREIESIFIPYGCIIFACHKTLSTRLPGQPQPHQQQQYFFDQQQQQFPNQSYVQDSWQQQQPGWANQPLPQQTGPFPRSPESTSSGGEVPNARQRVKDDGSGGAGPSKSAARAGGNPPVGVQKCSNCKSKTSPEWRKGPSGKKDLCNACGLRYARSRAKKEGHSTQRRNKKDKAGSEGPGPLRTKKSGSPAMQQQQWMDPNAAAMAFPMMVQSFDPYATFQAAAPPPQQFHQNPHQALSMLSSASFERAAVEQEKAAGNDDKSSAGPAVYVR